MRKQKLVVGMLTRNEEKRYLPQVLTSIRKYTSENVEVKLVVLDDASEDNTVAICESSPPVRIIKRKTPLFKEDGSKIKTELWEEMRKEKGDWCLVQDADELFEQTFIDRLPEFLNSRFEWINFRKCDMWDENHYRIDKFWSPCFKRLFRFKDLPFGWPTIKTHAPVIPHYVLESNIGTCYSDIRCKHLGWIKDEDKKKKAEFYKGRRMDAVDQFHMSTIFDPNLVLKEWKDKIEFPNILVVAPIRNRAWCVQEFLAGIMKQDYPKKKLSFFFLVNDSTDATLAILNVWAEEHKKEYRNILISQVNFGDTSKDEHTWEAQKLYRMGLMRNKCLSEIGNNDYVFSIDSDVVLKDERTLRHLSCLDKEVVAENVWASWGKIDNLLLPHAWRFGNFGGVDSNFIALLRNKGTYKVGGVCGCELISKSAIQKGANFSRVNNLPLDMGGEDRQFCTRCAVNDIYLWTDTFFTPQHLEKEIYDLHRNMIFWKMRRKPENKISLCLMGKNEEDYLDDFFYKMSPLFDEIIFLDTGSNDDTIAIAKKYTDKIYHFDWNDDYSLARNYLISKATNPWIFYADPDETYEYRKLQQFDKMIEVSEALGFAFVVYNFRDKGGVSVTESVRLFRNSRELYFTGRVHETLDEAIENISKKFPKLRVMLSPIKMFHWGFEKGTMKKNVKLAYYKKLDAQQIEEAPNDPRGYFNLALHLIEEGDKEGGKKLLKKAISLKETFIQPKEKLAFLYLRDALKLLNQVVEKFPKSHPRRLAIEQGVNFLKKYLG